MRWKTNLEKIDFRRKKTISQKKIPAVSQGLELYIVVLLPVILVKRMIKCPWIAGTRWKTKTEKTHFQEKKKTYHGISFSQFHGAQHRAQRLQMSVYTQINLSECPTTCKVEDGRVTAQICSVLLKSKLNPSPIQRFLSDFYSNIRFYLNLSYGNGVFILLVTK